MKSFSRRQLLQISASLGLASVMPQPQHSLAGMWSQLFGTPRRDLSPITPNHEFYITSYRTPPFLPAAQWTLSIHGQVNHPFTLTYAQLLAHPSVSEIVTLECVGNGVAGEAIGTAEWEGVRLRTLLDLAGITTKAYDVIFHAADGYTDSLRIERAMMDDVLVAHQMNGVPLPLGHGFPARIIAPGHYGMKHVQWLTAIEVTSSDHRGYYQQRDWSDEALVKTTSSITDPLDGDSLASDTSTMITGFAFAGSRGINKVDITTDGGQTWNPTFLKPALSPFSWVFWTYDWQPDRLGDHRLLVRAIDGTGQPQASIEQSPFPDGASGIHEVIVTVV